MKSKRSFLSSVALVAALCIYSCCVLITGCSTSQIKADIELRIVNDIKPVFVKDLQDGVAISNAQTPVYTTGLTCSTGMLAWLDTLPKPAALPGSNFCAPSDTTSTTCQHVDGLVSGAIALHVTALQSQAAPIALPPIDPQTKAYCLLMFADTGNDVAVAITKFNELIAGLALGKGVVNPLQAKQLAAALAARAAHP